MKSIANKSRLMKLSHEIQSQNHVNRSRALLSAWAITQHSNITILYLKERYSNKKNNHLNKANNKNLTLSLVA
jgi:hypothetical protein